MWDGDYPDAQLSKQGLAAYAQHPLMRTVSLDRGFYRPLTEGQYARYAAQVPDDFRFVVKAPSHVTDALVRGEDGRGRQPNPAFLSPELARSECVEPALQGLGHKLGALVFQLSPLPGELLGQLPEVLLRLHTLLQAVPYSDRVTVTDLEPAGIIAYGERIGVLQRQISNLRIASQRPGKQPFNLKSGSFDMGTCSASGYQINVHPMKCIPESA